MALGTGSRIGVGLQRYLHYVASTPKIIFLPVVFLLFGIGPGSKVAIGAFACSFPLAPAMRELCCPGTIVCRCEDVRSGQLAMHADWRSAKLQTRVGMGPCQGRVCGAACEFLYGWEKGSMRQPIFPTSAATLAECAKDQAS